MSALSASVCAARSANASSMLSMSVSGQLGGSHRQLYRQAGANDAHSAHLLHMRTQQRHRLALVERRAGGDADLADAQGFAIDNAREAVACDVDQDDQVSLM